jgi:murein DD-endopeptidase MepM/ murein hydrolase activator NlpD
VLEGRHTDALWAHEWRYREHFLKVLDQACGKEGMQRMPPELPPGIRVDRTWVYRLPIADHQKTRVIQAENENFSHHGVHEYAIDFDLPIGTPVVAMRAGQVIQVESRYDRGGPSDRYQAFANLIRIQHADGGVAEYVHLLKDSALVKTGDDVHEGQTIGRSGESGFASQPHLHVSIYLPEPDFPGLPQHSVPIQFDTQEEPAYRLKTGDAVTAVETGTYPRDFEFLLKKPNSAP